MVFNKKKKEKNRKNREELSSGVSATADKKRGVRKKKTLLQNLRETAWNSIFEEIFSETYPIRTQTNAYGLMIREEVLESASKGDESVGAFIHHINKGVIKAMVTDEIIQQGYFILLLDKETLLVVEEYPFIWNTPLEAICIDTDGEVTPTRIEYQPCDMLSFVNGEVSLTIGDVAIGVDKSDESWDEVEYEADDEDSFFSDDDMLEDFMDSSTSGDAFNDIEEEVELDSDYEEGLEETAFDWNENENEKSYDGLDTQVDENQFDSGEDSDDKLEFLDEGPEDLNDNMSKTGEPFLIPTKERVEQVVHRVFSEGDLDLAVDVGIFDAQFGDIGVIPFPEERGDGYLDQHLTKLSRDANQKLRQMRQVNHALLKDQYMTLMGRVCASVLDHTDINNPNTAPGQELVALNSSRRDQYAGIETKTAEMIEVLDKEWNEELEAYARQAYEAAIASYKQRHGYRNESKRASVRGDLERSIDQGYEYGVASLNTKRRTIASRLMDAGTNHTLATVSRLYAKQIKEENHLREELEKELVKFVKENYENELSRVRVLEQEMINRTEAKKVQDEYEARLASLMNDLNRQAETFDLDKKHFAESLSDLEREKDTCIKEQVSKSEKRYEEYEKELSDLRKELVQLDERKTEEFSRRMAVLEDALSASDKQLEIEVVRGKRAGRIATAIMVGVAIVSLAVGALAGTLARLENTGGYQSAYERSIDKEVGDEKE